MFERVLAPVMGGDIWLQAFVRQMRVMDAVNQIILHWTQELKGTYVKPNRPCDPLEKLCRSVSDILLRCIFSVTSFVDVFGRRKFVIKLKVLCHFTIFVS